MQADRAVQAASISGSEFPDHHGDPFGFSGVDHRDRFCKLDEPVYYAGQGLHALFQCGSYDDASGDHFDLCHQSLVPAYDREALAQGS